MKIRSLVCALVFAAAAAPAGAASVPAWLDEGISNWNTANPEASIRFVNIKDSYVWYDMPKGEGIDQKMIRDRIKKIVAANGYQAADDEDLVTTGKPPVTSGRSQPKKCWTRSFVFNIQALSDTKASGDGESATQRQRMLTSMVCEDTATWWAAFRVAD